MSNPHIALVLAAALLLVPFTGIASADVCIVADSTGTPLNVRNAMGSPAHHARARTITAHELRAGSERALFPRAPAT
jgi:hypothetical protein